MQNQSQKLSFRLFQILPSKNDKKKEKWQRKIAYFDLWTFMPIFSVLLKINWISHLMSFNWE